MPMTAEGAEVCDVRLCGASLFAADGATAFCDLEVGHDGAHQGFAWLRCMWADGD